MLVDYDGGSLGLKHLKGRAVGCGGYLDSRRRVLKSGIACPVGYGILNGVLYLGIDRQVYVIAASAKLVFERGAVRLVVLDSALLEHMGYDVVYAVLDEVGHIVELLFLALFDYANLLVKGGFVLLVRYVSGVVHGGKHRVRPLVRDVHLVRAILVKAGVGVCARIGVIGLLNHAGKHCAFPDGKLIQLLAEIVLGGGGKAVVRFTEENIVHVCLKYLVLAHDVLKLIGKIGLLYLTLVALLIGEYLVLYELLRERGAAVGV